MRDSNGPTWPNDDQPGDADSALLVHTQMNHLYGRGAGRPRDADWLARRVELYLRYTVPSLARQADRRFTIWLDCRAGSEWQLEPHIDALLAADVRVTFDRGARLLDELPSAVRQVYVTRIDSDDLYAPDAIALIHRLHGAAAASQFYRGYVCDLASGEIRRVALRSPPFYTLRFARGEFTSAADLWPLLAPRPERPGAPRGHSVVRERFSPVALPHARFCILRHDTNTGGNIRGQRVTCPAALAEIRERFALPTAVATA